MIYKGKVKSGLGEGSVWMEKAKNIFKQKYNIDVFLGTLNIELDNKIIISEGEKILPSEYGGNLYVFVQKCKVNDSLGYIVRTEKNNRENGDHPLNILEIVSNVNFREKYNLKDNDEVKLEILFTENLQKTHL